MSSRIDSKMRTSVRLSSRHLTDFFGLPFLPIAVGGVGRRSEDIGRLEEVEMVGGREYDAAPPDLELEPSIDAKASGARAALNSVGSPLRCGGCATTRLTTGAGAGSVRGRLAEGRPPSATLRVGLRGDSPAVPAASSSAARLLTAPESTGFAASLAELGALVAIVDAACEFSASVTLSLKSIVAFRNAGRRNAEC